MSLPNRDDEFCKKCENWLGGPFHRRECGPDAGGLEEIHEYRRTHRTCLDCETSFPIEDYEPGILRCDYCIEQHRNRIARSKARKADDIAWDLEVAKAKLVTVRKRLDAERLLPNYKPEDRRALKTRPWAEFIFLAQLEEVMAEDIRRVGRSRDPYWNNEGSVGYVPSWLVTGNANTGPRRMTTRNDRGK